MNVTTVKIVTEEMKLSGKVFKNGIFKKYSYSDEKF